MIKIANEFSEIKRRLEEIQKARLEAIINKPIEETKTPDPYKPYEVSSEGYG